MGKIFLEKGIAWAKDKFSRDGRKGFTTLQEMLDYQAKKNCCGINCCENALYLKTAAGVPVKVTVEIIDNTPQFVFSTPD